jgi:lipoate-protein ligase A
MAVDEALLLQAADDEVGTLRFYQWSEPTLSLGYFQPHADRRQHPASQQCAVVRRQTGGGAILHDRELTYSLALPAGHPLALKTQRLYRIVHEAFVLTLESRLATAGHSRSLEVREMDSELSPSDEPFLCFLRRARGDVVLNDARRHGPERVSIGAVKILGSAQRRLRGAILQHGSLLLESSPAAPELPGLRDCTGLAISVDQLIGELSRRISEAVKSRLIEAPLPDELRPTICRLRAGKYESPDWTFRR